MVNVSCICSTIHEYITPQAKSRSYSTRRKCKIEFFALEYIINLNNNTVFRKFYLCKHRSVESVFFALFLHNASFFLPSLFTDGVQCNNNIVGAK